MVRKVLTASGALLGAFHVWLFIGQAGDGSLADAGLLARWGVAAGLVAALWYLRRQNVSLVWGRKAVAVWLLAAVLHGPSLGDRIGNLDTMATAEATAALFQVAAGAAVITFLVLAVLIRRRSTADASCWPQLAGPSTYFASHSIASAPFAPRPPPVR